MQVLRDERSSDPHRPRRAKALVRVPAKRRQGEYIGQPLSRENLSNPGADVFHAGSLGRSRWRARSCGLPLMEVDDDPRVPALF